MYEAFISTIIEASCFHHHARQGCLMWSSCCNEQCLTGSAGQLVTLLAGFDGIHGLTSIVMCHQREGLVRCPAQL